MTLRYDVSNQIDGGVKLYSEMGKTGKNEFENEADLGRIKNLLWVMLNLKYPSDILVDMSRRKLGIRNSREVLLEILLQEAASMQLVFKTIEMIKRESEEGEREGLWDPT